MEDPRQIWDSLLTGNARFRKGASEVHFYSAEEVSRLASEPSHPRAVVIACSDSRVSPEIIFDQPLGCLFVSRVPGNCATESARWAVELAVGELGVPLVVVMAHTGCLAVGQIIDGRVGGPGGSMRLTISYAVHRARQHGTADLLREAVVENAKMSARELIDNLPPLRKALNAGTAQVVVALYDMPTGLVHEMEWIAS